MNSSPALPFPPPPCGVCRGLYGAAHPLDQALSEVELKMIASKGELMVGGRVVMLGCLEEIRTIQYRFMMILQEIKKYKGIDSSTVPELHKFFIDFTGKFN